MPLQWPMTLGCRPKHKRSFEMQDPLEKLCTEGITKI